MKGLEHLSSFSVPPVFIVFSLIVLVTIVRRAKYDKKVSFRGILFEKGIPNQVTAV